MCYSYTQNDIHPIHSYMLHHEKLDYYQKIL